MARMRHARRLMRLKRTKRIRVAGRRGEPRLERAAAILRRIPEGAPAIAAEIGVATGRLSMMLLRKRPLLSLTMVDLWEHNPSPDYAATNDPFAMRTSNAWWESARRMATRQTSPFRMRRTIIQSDSVAAASQFADKHFDLVFIDDDHSFTGCLRSIKAWFLKVKLGGWCSGHDYGNPPDDFDTHVQEAVHAFFDPLKLPVELDLNWTWFVRVPDA